jgi:hypothetical protein
MIDRISAGAIGAVRDDDIEEFVPVGGTASHTQLKKEVDELFSRPADESDAQIDDSIANILEAMAFEQNKKQFIIDCKSRGLSLEEAREEYEAAKAALVRKALNLPDEPMDVPVIYGDDSEE